MTEFRSGQIKLDSQKAVFYSGQLVSGSIVFNLTAPLNISALNVEYIGQAEVLWTENMKEVQLGRERIKVVEYKGNEEYFQYSECLAGGTGGITQLPPGSHSYPFKFHIPHTAPSSFAGEVGSVIYSITATLMFPDPNVLSEALFKEFQVIAPMDLNTGNPEIKYPINMEFEEVYGCDCICTPKPMNIRVNIPVSGYCPGQDIPITVDVENESSTEISSMIFKLICREKYHSQKLPAEYVPEEKVLVAAKKGSVMGHTKTSVAFSLTVPHILPPCLNNCSIIDVAYFIKVTFKLSGCAVDLNDEAEIYLGLIPISAFLKGPYIHPLKHNLPDGPIPDPNQPLEFAPPPRLVQPALNPAFEKSRFTSAVNSQNTFGYPGGVNTAYPSVYPTQNIELSSRPNSGIGFVVAPAYPIQSYGNNSNVCPGGAAPSAPPPYA